MKKLLRLVQKAKQSKFYLALLNVLLLRTIPFNRPHGLRILEITDDGFKIFLPYKRKNLNHLHGIHACALAALAEYTAGLTLIYKLQSDQYRLIMKNLSVVFHFQAKANVLAKLELSDVWMQEKILSPLENSESVLAEMNVDVYDIHENHICTTTVNWQIKKWDKVKTTQ